MKKKLKWILIGIAAVIHTVLSVSADDCKIR